MIDSTFKRVNVEEIRSLWVRIPPVQEQGRIVEYLLLESAKIDALISEAQKAIDLLQECRTALISAGVTGKIDVRVITS